MDQPVNIRSLLEAAVHFGHQTRRWNPKMKPYIFGERNGVYILDLKQTMIGLDRAFSFVRSLASQNGAILFVGTKKQAQEPVFVHAERCGMPYVNHRWLGGMLTNFVTIRGRVSRMEELEAMEADGRMAALPKKEQITLRKQLSKLRENLDGIRNMKGVPQAIFVVDTHREMIAIREARRLGIPVVGIIDTNSDPDDVDYGVPGNDDAIRSVNIITEVIAEAVIAGTDKAQFSEAEMIGGNDEPAPPVASGGEVAAFGSALADAPAPEATLAPTVALTAETPSAALESPIAEGEPVVEASAAVVPAGLAAAVAAPAADSPADTGFAAPAESSYVVADAE
ncbi:MAG: 30S ribosomal protein S2 [Actinomycetia bacterium]|nr:30S ribosomal protein S2 [Actinomycetes bacterium]